MSVQVEAASMRLWLDIRGQLGDLENGVGQHFAHKQRWKFSARCLLPSKLDLRERNVHKAGTLTVNCYSKGAQAEVTNEHATARGIVPQILGALTSQSPP